MNDEYMHQDGPGIKPRKKRPHEIDPWYKRFARDFHEGTRELTLEERGAYSDIIDLIFMQAGPIKNDDRIIAGKLCVDVRTWRRLRKRLFNLGKLFITPEGIHNARAKEVLDAREEERRRMGMRGDLGVQSTDNQGSFHPDLFENVIDFNARRRATSTDSDLQIKREKEEEKKRTVRRPIPRDLLDALIEQEGKEQAELLVDEYHTSGCAARARSLRSAFKGWLEKEQSIVLEVKETGAFNVGAIASQALGDLCGRDKFGKPDTSLPKVVRRKG